MTLHPRSTDSRNAYWAFAALGPLALYGAFLGLAAIPFFQRQAIYAHKFHTLWWNDVDKPEKWGFATNQVTPFHLTTPDNERLYLWHILPLSIYSQHEQALIRQPFRPLDQYAATESFRIIKEDPDARLVLSFHGNAGHVAQNMRAPQYHLLTATSKWHVMAIDYRGFGHSTGSPTEEGLITDASTLVDFAMNTIGIPPNRIVLLGQSLGTAVASATAERYSSKGIEFAGVVLVASFSSLPTMLSNYSIAGFVPVLRPLAICPPLLRFVLTFIVDKWKSLDRLAALVTQTCQRGGKLRLSLIHAANDWDIPCNESQKIFAAVANATVDGGYSEQEFMEMKDARTVVTGKNSFKVTWKADRDIVITHEQYGFGGHNDVMIYPPVPQAIMAAFATVETTTTSV